jgi:hypothetical protein
MCLERDTRTDCCLSRSSSRTNSTRFIGSEGHDNGQGNTLAPARLNITPHSIRGGSSGICMNTRSLASTCLLPARQGVHLFPLLPRTHQHSNSTQYLVMIETSPANRYWPHALFVLNWLCRLVFKSDRCPPQRGSCAASCLFGQVTENLPT